jgi:hypothetical protein
MPKEVNLVVTIPGGNKGHCSGGKPTWAMMEDLF